MNVSRILVWFIGGAADLIRCENLPGCVDAITLARNAAVVGGVKADIIGQSAMRVFNQMA